MSSEASEVYVRIQRLEYLITQLEIRLKFLQERIAATEQSLAQRWFQ
jgi:peptidoglycan hydrolase CwlO-like protein